MVVWKDLYDLCRFLRCGMIDENLNRYECSLSKYSFELADILKKLTVLARGGQHQNGIRNVDGRI